MKKRGVFLLAALFFCGVLASGCEIALAPLLIDQEKHTLDWVGQAAAPVDYAWRAALKTAEDLSISVDSQVFDSHEGMISGHSGRLEFIRIYVSQVTPDSTRIGIQARTCSYPLYKSGYDIDFAQSIMDKIHDNVQISFYGSDENNDS